MDKQREIETKDISREATLNARIALSKFIVRVASGKEYSDEELAILPAIAKIFLEY